MNRIKELRKARGLSQAQLADEMGVVKQLIRKR
ncbi:helix-turn-helix domain-containing protein [Lactobacillus helveticus]|nr:helix-turn-helix transcriptional regulator [Lactobacillus helveticus]MCO0806717.1 helix-turn-helix domain-containing protein [Lactobacillus helveticus]